MSKSIWVARAPPTWIVSTTKSASSSAARRSRCAEIRGRAPSASAVQWAIRSAGASRSGSMSCSTSSTSRSSGYDRKSPSRLRVNSTLPAPTSTIRIDAPLDADDVGETLAVVALDPAGTIRIETAARRELEREEREGRDRDERRVVLVRIRCERQEPAAGHELLRTDLDDACAPAGCVTEHGAGRRSSATIRGDADDDGVGVDDRRGAGFHLPGLRSLGVDERGLLELERGLERSDVGKSPTEHEPVLSGRELGGEIADDRERGVDGSVGCVGRRVERSSPAVELRVTEQPREEQLRRRQRRRERLRHDRDVTGTTGRPDDVRGDGSERRFGDVDDADHRDDVAELARNGDDVAEFARGGDPDDRVTRPESRSVSAELCGGRGDDDRIVRT